MLFYASPLVPFHKIGFFGKLLSRLLRACLHQDSLEPALQTALLGTFFAMTPAYPFAQSEKWHFGTGRWSWFGTRQVVLTREEALMRFHRARMPGEPQPSFAQLWAYFKDMTAELLAMYLENQGKGSTFTCTVAPGEFLYTPPAYVVCERSHADCCLGVRVAILRTGDHEDLFKVCNYLDIKTTTANGKQTPLHTAVKAFITSQ